MNCFLQLSRHYSLQGMFATFYYSHTLCLLFSFLYFLPSTTSFGFQFPHFDSSSAILYQGDAEPSNGRISFNKLTFTCRVGLAMYAEKVPLWNSKTGELADFTTHYSFIIDRQNHPIAGHGLTFFLAPEGFRIPPNSYGGFLGLFNTTTITDPSRNQIFLVEFDSYPDSDWDPVMEHVGINENSLSSAVHTSWNATLHSGDTADVSIVYNSTSKNLSISWKYQKTSNSHESTSLSHQIDLRKILPEWVTVGFSAATGEFGEIHTLLSWELESTLDMNSKANNANDAWLVIVVVASGFALTIGALLAYAAFRRSRKIKSETVAAVSSFGALVASAAFWRWTKKKRETAAAASFNLISGTDDLEKGLGPRRFSYADLVLATSNFSKERKLGEGGFGTVYRGYLTDQGMEVAVKRISRGSRQGRKEFITEVKVISRLRHRNLVQLIGWCHDGGKFLLVYEFMPHGSLDFHLFGPKSPLAWDVRHKIYLGLASGLLYLHEECEKCVVHRDIKASNIMLDAAFNAKLGDFGLARLADHNQSPQTTGLAGTLGYLAPECISTGKASKESDVFSFGVVALEIATGRKSTNYVEQGSEVLLEWVWDLYGKGQILSAMDKKLSEFDDQQAESLLIVGLWCAHPDRNKRPSVRQAIQVLNFEEPRPNLPKKMPPLFPILAASTSSAGGTMSMSSIIGR